MPRIITHQCKFHDLIIELYLPTWRRINHAIENDKTNFNFSFNLHAFLYLRFTSIRFVKINIALIKSDVYKYLIIPLEFEKNFDENTYNYINLKFMGWELFTTFRRWY